MKKRRVILVVALILALGLGGCQESPDSSIVVNKDMDKLVEKAQDGESSSSVEDMRQYETYKTTLEDESLGVYVEVDAKVDIPETSQLSVFRVKQKAISQEFLDKARTLLLPEETLYDGGILETVTKASLEKEIAEYKASIAEEELSDEDKEVYQSEIDMLQEQYENAPDEIIWEGNESDGKLIDMADKQDATDSYYSWAYNLNPNGQIYYGVSRGENGEYISLYAQNNEERGNSLRYRRSAHGYEFVSFPQVSNLTDAEARYIWAVDEEPPESLKEKLAASGSESGPAAYEDEAVTISLEEAVSLAEEFLSNAGIDDFQYYEGGLYNEWEDIRYGGIAEESGDTYEKYATKYILRYMRNIDGAFVTFDSTGKHEESWSGGDYVKKDWSIECIEFRITDDGIIGFDYNAPLEITETVVESSALKSFDEVKGTFEQMITVANASEEVEGERMKSSLKIDRVKLGYVRISEADSYDTGLLVPAWDFMGSEELADMQDFDTSYGSLLTINAIDGSIIDRSLGY